MAVGGTALAPHLPAVSWSANPVRDVTMSPVSHCTWRGKRRPYKQSSPAAIPAAAAGAAGAAGAAATAAAAAAGAVVPSWSRGSTLEV